MTLLRSLPPLKKGGVGGDFDIPSGLHSLLKANQTVALHSSRLTSFPLFFQVLTVDA